jgi:hypothetical protein
MGAFGVQNAPAFCDSDQLRLILALMGAFGVQNAPAFCDSDQLRLILLRELIRPWPPFFSTTCVVSKIV